MVNRMNEAQEPNVNSPSNTDHSSVHTKAKAAAAGSDEVIVSLANNYENRRARQVTEWERVQATNIRRSA
jgi:hypothetical protein